MIERGHPVTAAGVGTEMVDLAAGCQGPGGCSTSVAATLA